VQQRQELATKSIQAFKVFGQKRLFTDILYTNKEFQFPWLMRLPILRSLLTRLIAFGVFPVHVQS